MSFSFRFYIKLKVYRIKMDASFSEMDQAEERFAEELEKESATQNTTPNQDLNEISVRDEVAPRTDETSWMFLHKGRLSGKRLIRPSNNQFLTFPSLYCNESLSSDEESSEITQEDQIMPEVEEDVGVIDINENGNENIAANDNNGNMSDEVVNDDNENMKVNIDPVSLSHSVKYYLTYNQIRWEKFATLVLGISQPRLSTLLSKPKPWHVLSKRVQALYERMQLWMDTRATFGNNPYMRTIVKTPEPQKMRKKGNQKQKKKPRSLLELDENEKLFESVKDMKATENERKVDNHPANKINQASETPVKKETDVFSDDCLIRCDVCSHALPGSQAFAEHALRQHVASIEGFCDVCGADAKTSDFVKHFTTHMKSPHVDAVPKSAGLIIMNDESLVVKNIKEESIEQNVEDEDPLSGDGQWALNPFYGKDN